MKIEKRACANTPVLPSSLPTQDHLPVSKTTIERREAQKVTACAVSSILVPTSTLAAPADTQTSIMRLFRQRCEFRDAIDHAAVNDKNLCEKILDVRIETLREMEAELMRLPTTYIADFAAKVIVDSVDSGCLPDWEKGSVWQEARVLTGCYNLE